MSFNALSNPFEGDFSVVADQLARRCFRRALRSVDDRAREYGHDALGIDALPDSAAPGVSCWTPELGSVGCGLRSINSAAHWDWLSAQMKTAAYVAGWIDRVEVEVDGPHPFAVAGHLLAAERLRLDGNAERLRVTGGDGKLRLVLSRRQPSGVSPVWVANEEDFVQLGSAGVVVLSKGEWIKYWQPEREEGQNMVYAPDLERHRRKLQEAMRIMEELVPHYYVWVCLVLREIVPLRDAAGKNSSSSAMWPGLVNLDESSPIAMIDALIHECSHQYFAMLLWHAPLVAADAPEGYSVLKRTQRPIDRILSGFHAVGNSVLAFAQLCQALSLAERLEAELTMREQHGLLRELDRVLQESGQPYFTETGRALYVPLRERLLDAGLLRRGEGRA